MIRRLLTALRLTRRDTWHRTPDDVARDAAAHRAQLDLAECFDIWADAPTWKTAKAQYRLDTAKQRKENEQ